MKMLKNHRTVHFNGWTVWQINSISIKLLTKAEKVVMRTWIKAIALTMKRRGLRKLVDKKGFKVKWISWLAGDGVGEWGIRVKTREIPVYFFEKQVSDGVSS